MLSIKELNQVGLDLEQVAVAGGEFKRWVIYDQNEVVALAETWKEDEGKKANVYWPCKVSQDEVDAILTGVRDAQPDTIGQYRPEDSEIILYSPSSNKTIGMDVISTQKTRELPAANTVFTDQLDPQDPFLLRAFLLSTTLKREPEEMNRITGVIFSSISEILNLNN